MEIANLIHPDVVKAQLGINSKKAVISQLSQLLVNNTHNFDGDKLMAKLTERERFGSTGIGKGVAIPHCRIDDCIAPCGSLITITSPIDFLSYDDEPVDIFFALIVPELQSDDHLLTLRNLAKLFSRDEILTQIRNATNAESLCNIVTQ